jgi:hypothetical protein
MRPSVAWADVLATTLGVDPATAAALPEELAASSGVVTPWPPVVGDTEATHGFDRAAGAAAARFGVPGVVRWSAGPDGKYDGTGSLSWGDRSLALPAPGDAVSAFYADTAEEIGGVEARRSYLRCAAAAAALEHMSEHGRPGGWFRSRVYRSGRVSDPGGELSVRIVADCCADPRAIRVEACLSKEMAVRSPGDILEPVPLSESAWREWRAVAWESASDDGVGPVADYLSAVAAAESMLASLDGETERMYVVGGARSFPLVPAYGDYLSEHRRCADGGERELVRFEAAPLLFPFPRGADVRRAVGEAVASVRAATASTAAVCAEAHRREAAAYAQLKAAAQHPAAARAAAG